MRKWIPVLIIAAALIASAIVYPDLPERMPTHWNLSGEPDDWSRRVWGAWMIPFMIAVVWGLTGLLPAIDPRKANYAKFAGAFEGIMLSVMLFMLVVHGLILRSALGYPVAMDRVMPVGIGILFVVIGNLLPRARPNWFVGIRTPWTLSSDRVWERTHRLGGRLFVVGGILISLSAFLGPNWSQGVLIGVIAACSLGAVAYSYLEWRREKETSGASTV